MSCRKTFFFFFFHFARWFLPDSRWVTRPQRTTAAFTRRAHEINYTHCFGEKHKRFVIICERDWTLKSENESPILQTYTAGPKQSISLKPSGSCKWTLDCLEEPPQANSSSFKICESKLWVTKTHCWKRKSCSDILLCKKEDYKELRGKMNHRFLSRQVYFTCVDTQRLNKDSTIWLGSRWSRFAVIRHPAAAACAASVITCERAALMKVHVFVLVCRSRWVGPDERSRYKL